MTKKDAVDLGRLSERVRILIAVKALTAPGSKKLYCFYNRVYIRPEDVLRIVGGTKK